MDRLTTILEFQSLLKAFNSVYRDLCSIHTPGERDNDVEHSYRVAMLVWMINEHYSFGFDTSKLLRYALVHDFVEVYAGDLSIHAEYAEADKAENERKALLRLREKFPHLSNIWETIDAYEKREDPESKFVYIIEKLEPGLTIFLSDRQDLKKRGAVYERLVENKESKVRGIDSPAQLFHREVMQYLKDHRKELFDT